MKNIAVILILIVPSFFSCRKEPFRGDYFIFGKYYGECGGDCEQYFMVKDNRLYADRTAGRSETMKFKFRQLPEEKYSIAKDLNEKFPKTLRATPSAIYGCPDCRDQGGYYFEFQEASVRHEYHIDSDTSEIPAELRSFVVELERVLGEL